MDERFPSRTRCRLSGKVMAVGSNRGYRSGRAEDTPDQSTAAILPGFIDTHSHLFDYAPANWANDLKPSNRSWRGIARFRADSVDEAIDFCAR